MKIYSGKIINQNYDAVILAAGSGSRYTESGGLSLKQVQIYRGLPIIRRLYDQLLEINEVDNIYVVLSDNEEHQKLIKESLPVKGPKYVVNSDSRRDNNLISFLLGTENICSGAVIVESDCVFDSTDIRNVMAATAENEICFANIGSLAAYQYGGVVEFNQTGDVIAIHVLAVEEMVRFHDMQKSGLKLFGMTAFGKNALREYVATSKLIDPPFSKYFLEAAISNPTKFQFKTVPMKEKSFSFNTVSEFENG